MNEVLFEQNIIQNSALGAEAIWQSSLETYEQNRRTEGMRFHLAFIVLPLVYHKKTASALASKTRPGALYKALAEDREIVLGLQSRMEALSDRTLASLNIGFSSKLFNFDHNGGAPQLIPGRKSAVVSHITNDVKTLLAAAKRVGQTFAELSDEQIASHLNIKF